MANETKKREETFFEKERRLKKRKQSLKFSIRKGVYYLNKERLTEYINQPDVLISIQSHGSLDDDTDFLQITIEGFKAAPDGI